MTASAAAIDNPLDTVRRPSRAAPVRPTAAFVGTAWVAFGAGAIGYLAGLWNAPMALETKGY